MQHVTCEQDCLFDRACTLSEVLKLKESLSRTAAERNRVLERDCIDDKILQISGLYICIAV